MAHHDFPDEVEPTRRSLAWDAVELVLTILLVVALAALVAQLWT